MHHRQSFHTVFRFRLNCLKPIVIVFINRVFDEINVFEFGLVEMENPHIRRSKTVFRNDFRFRQKMRQIVPNGQVVIDVVHVFKQGFVGVFAVALNHLSDCR
jgi:hypothetical protein